jgi:cbb3-type cytochrome oxidase maturation protein
MGIIVLLILISITIAVVFLGIFYWNIKSGQYDDTYTPSVRMLFEDKVNDSPKDKGETVVDKESGKQSTVLP